jgi:hypothetical protein
MFPVTCPSCGVATQATEKNAGRRTKCPACGAVFVIPAAPVPPDRTRPPVSPRQQPLHRPALSPGAKAGRRRQFILLAALALAIGIIARVKSRTPQPAAPEFHGHGGVVVRPDTSGENKNPAPPPPLPTTLPDGHFMPGRIAMLIRVIAEFPDSSGKAMQVVRQGLEQTSRGLIASADTIISADGFHTARITTVKEPAKSAFAVMVDGAAGNPMTGSITHLQFSPSGRHYAFLVHHPGALEQASVFVDGIDLKRPLFGNCTSFHYAEDDRRGNVLHVLLAGPDRVLRLLELRIVPALPSSATKPE